MLTFGIGWLIVCTMNANVITPTANPRLNRIKKLSRFLKMVSLLFVLLCFVVLGVALAGADVNLHFQAGGQNFSSLREIPAELIIYEAFRCLLFLLAFIAFYRLLNLYEKGIIFSAKNVLQIRRLGVLAVFYGVITACLPIFADHRIEIPLLPLNILFSPWLFVGCLTLVIAWVMDEGRKIQEEGELTV
jgi:hypothetical protein